MAEGDTETIRAAVTEAALNRGCNESQAHGLANDTLVKLAGGAAQAEREPWTDENLAGWARNWHWNDCAEDKPVDPSIYFRDLRMLKAFLALATPPQGDAGREQKDEMLAFFLAFFEGWEPGTKLTLNNMEALERARIKVAEMGDAGREAASASSWTKIDSELSAYIQTIRADLIEECAKIAAQRPATHAEQCIADPDAVRSNAADRIRALSTVSGRETAGRDETVPSQDGAAP